jgi:hypothetical protein
MWRLKKATRQQNAATPRGADEPDAGNLHTEMARGTFLLSRLISIPIYRQ